MLMPPTIILNRSVSSLISCILKRMMSLARRVHPRPQNYRPARGQSGHHIARVNASSRNFQPARYRRMPAFARSGPAPGAQRGQNSI